MIDDDLNVWTKQASGRWIKGGMEGMTPGYTVNAARKSSQVIKS